MNIPWIEKYRPKKLSHIVQQEEIIRVLKNTLQTGNLPHLLFYGPPGTGKTSTILAIARELFGPKRIEERVIELNASDERGIKIVRENIISFARVTIGTPDPDYPSPPFKLVILDEADAMTPDAQAALRKIMETMTHITRFCFVCNYINQIIDPISSRCMKFRFKPLSNINIVKHLTKISHNEKMKIEENAIEKIAFSSNGDLRRAIMILQNLKYMEKCFGIIKNSNVASITGDIEPSEIDFTKLTSIQKTIEFVRQLDRKSYPYDKILIILKDKIINEPLFDEQKKAEILLELCKTEKYLTEGCNELLQILNVFCFIYSKLKN
jgi:replication factor C subunit 2/4